MGFFEIFSPSFQSNNSLFNAFALKAVTKYDIKASFNYKKKDFIRAHKIYKLNLKLKNFKFSLCALHKFTNTVVPGLLIKKLVLKLNSFSKLKNFSFLFENCLTNQETFPAFKSKFTSYYDVGFTLDSKASFFLESLLKKFQVPLNLLEYKHESYNSKKNNNMVYTL